jgi:hypothetical protein
MFVSFDITDKNNPLSVALLTGGENFKVTIHESQVSELPSIERSEEAFQLAKKNIFQNYFYD